MHEMLPQVEFSICNMIKCLVLLLQPYSKSKLELATKLGKILPKFVSLPVVISQLNLTKINVEYIHEMWLCVHKRKIKILTKLFASFKFDFSGVQLKFAFRIRLLALCLFCVHCLVYIYFLIRIVTWQLLYSLK